MPADRLFICPWYSTSSFCDDYFGSEINRSAQREIQGHLPNEH